MTQPKSSESNLPPCPFCGSQAKSHLTSYGERRVYCTYCMWSGLNEAQWQSLACVDRESLRNALVGILPLASAYAKAYPSLKNQALVAIATGAIYQFGLYSQYIPYDPVAEAELRAFRLAVERCSQHHCEQCGMVQTALNNIPM